MAVAIWSQLPTRDALLADRFARGWRPLASNLATGKRVKKVRRTRA
jgi:hypothetical protein